jgi:integrase
VTKIDNFLEGNYPPGSYNYVLKKFLKKRRGNVSEASIDRLYYSLHPIGREWERPFKELNCLWLKIYVDELWLRYARDSMRTIIGDIRQFFRWCKKKGHLSRNIAKSIKPVRRRRSRHTKAATESDVKEIIKNLADQLKASGLVYCDLFSIPQAA